MIFLSAPYSHKNEKIKEERIEIITKYSAYLTSKRIINISPTIYGHILLPYEKLPSDWKFWKEFCISFLEKCKKVYVLKLNGWEDSEGVKNEIKLANELNLPIEFITLEEIKKCVK